MQRLEFNFCSLSTVFSMLPIEYKLLVVVVPIIPLCNFLAALSSYNVTLQDRD